MPTAAANGIEIEYESFGDPDRPPLLLIMGVGGQMIDWPDPFCTELAGRGFHVVRYDNRDCGLSTRIEDGPEPDLVAAYFGDPSSASYTLDDMADDAVGLLEQLDIPAAHLVGRSLGGMIAQALVIRHPDRCLSLCCISSSTGDRAVGQPTAEALELMAREPVSRRDAYVEADLAAHRALRSPAYPSDEDEVRRKAERSFDRAFYPEGTARQLCAILVSPDRTPALSNVSVPTLVVHGSADILVQPSGGEATAAAVPGARLMMIEGMGHDFPPVLWPRVMDAIVENAARAARPGS